MTHYLIVLALVFQPSNAVIHQEPTPQVSKANQSTKEQPTKNKELDEKLSGIWQVAFSSGREKTTGPMHSKLLIINQDGNHLKVKDVEKGKEFQGVESRNGVLLPITIRLLPENEDKNITLAGVLTGGKTLSGSAMINGTKIDWTAIKLASVWVCTNHTPRHAATSTEEMDELTKTYGCCCWKQLPPSEMKPPKKP